MKTFVQIAYIFHPGMGYDVNLLLRHFKGRYKNILITSADVSLWNETADSIAEKDKAFEAAYQCQIIRLPFFKFSKGGTVPFILRLRKTLKKIKPDFTFVHGLESHAFMLSLLTILKHGGKVGLDTHTLYNQIERAGFLWKCYRSLVLKPFGVGKINKNKIPVFYTAPDNRHFLIHYLGIQEPLIHNNEIATNLETFHYERDENLAKSLGILTGEKVLMYIGKFDTFKKPHLIYEALKVYGNRAPFPIHVIFAGPRNEGYYQEYFSALPAIENIRYTHLPALPNEDLFRYYSLAEVLVIPEQNSLSALDAQACGTPVIMKDDDTNRARLKEGGLVYTPGSVQDLWQKINQILTDSALRKKLSANGRKYIATHFDYSKTMEKVEQILSGSPTPSDTR